MKGVYWWLYIVRLSFRWIFSLNIGDEVWFEGEKWMAVQGVCDPSWNIQRGGERREYIDRSRFKKVKSLRNYTSSFLRGYHFYMVNWYDIWRNEGIKQWMRGCNIWKRPITRLIPLLLVIVMLAALSACATTSGPQMSFGQPQPVQIKDSAGTSHLFNFMPFTLGNGWVNHTVGFSVFNERAEHVGTNVTPVTGLVDSAASLAGQGLVPVASGLGLVK